MAPVWENVTLTSKLSARLGVEKTVVVKRSANRMEIFLEAVYLNGIFPFPLHRKKFSKHHSNDSMAEINP